MNSMTRIEFDVMPESYMIMNLFPVEVVKYKPVLKRYIAPRLSGKNIGNNYIRESIQLESRKESKIWNWTKRNWEKITSRKSRTDQPSSK